MIKVEQLTKKYPGVVAIHNLSFEVDKGEIVGFLGPNGAGKSTTMRILSSFMPATSGRASIAGHRRFQGFSEGPQASRLSSGERSVIWRHAGQRISSISRIVEGAERQKTPEPSRYRKRALQR